MREFSAAILDSILAMPAGTIIGGVFLALLLALPVAVAQAAAARRQGKDGAMPLVVAAMLANLIGMSVASGQVWRVMRGEAGPPATSRPIPPATPPAGDDELAEGLAWLALMNGDADRDWSLSSEEATRLAEQFVRNFAGSGKDEADATAIKEAFLAYILQARVNQNLIGKWPDEPRPGSHQGVPDVSDPNDKGRAGRPR